MTKEGRAAPRKAVMAIWCLCFCGCGGARSASRATTDPEEEDSRTTLLHCENHLWLPTIFRRLFRRALSGFPSSIRNDHLHRTDLPTVKVPDTIRAFEEFIGIILSAEDGRCTPEAAKVCTEVILASAAQTRDEFIVTTSALWRFLFDPVEDAINTHRLGGMAQNNGSALLAASLDRPGDHWRFQLFATPRWPAL